MKTLLRIKNGSKFKDVNLVLDEKKRKEKFVEYLSDGDRSRKKVIEAFFRSTFDAWENYYTEANDKKYYVGYSPAIGIDAERIIRDFPNVKIIHVVRNPFSAYRDTKRRPFPQPINRYLITWNIYHSTVEMFSKLYPNNVKIVRYEDLVENKKKFMEDICEFINIPFSDTMLYPSWNGEKIEKSIAPWGTVLKSTAEYNKEVIDELSQDEKDHIVAATTALARHFGYDKIDYLSKYYDK